MALFTGSSDIIPRSISARSAVALERKIHMMQRKEGYEYKFINFYFDGENHIGWYYALLTEEQQLKETLEKRNGRSKK